MSLSFFTWAWRANGNGSYSKIIFTLSLSHITLPAEQRAFGFEIEIQSPDSWVSTNFLYVPPTRNFVDSSEKVIATFSRPGGWMLDSEFKTIDIQCYIYKHKHFHLQLRPERSILLRFTREIAKAFSSLSLTWHNKQMFAYRESVCDPTIA